MKNQKIAIIGKAYRLPTEIENDKDLWNALISEKDLITEVSNDIFDKRKFFHQDKSRQGKAYCFSAGILDEAEKFDPSFFKISQKEAAYMDPQQRILMELSWNALEDTGYNPYSLRGSNCGVYIGIYDMDYSLNGASDLSALESYSPMGGAMSIAANRISYFFDFRGPSMAIDTACSSVMVALHQACSAIKSGEIEMAVVGGVNLFQHPQPFVGLSKANMLSPEGRCKSFSNSNNGYVRSEGAVVLVIKSLEQAEKDGDMILGVLLNTVTNCDGKTNGLPLPSSDAQCRLMEKAYSEIDLDFSKISYLEAHGTGTKVGDPVEISSISRAIALKREKKLPVGSIKSNLGHLEPASGFAGILKGLMCIKHRIIPSTIHCKELNSTIDFDKANIHIVNKPYSLDEDDEIIIGVNSFGFGGSNAHAILTEYKTPVPQHPKYENEYSIFPPLILTANSEKSLKDLALKYSDLLKENSSNYYDIAYNLVYNKPKHKNFAAIYGFKDISEAATLLRQYSENNTLDSNFYVGTKGRVEGNTALVFTGNGCQWFGMGRNLLENSPEIDAYFKEADEIFKDLAGFSIVEKIKTDTDEELYSDTKIAQPALLIIQIGIVKYLRSKGLNYNSVVGHSVGEIGAAWACDALTLKDAITLIYYKSLAQSETRHTGKMAVIGKSEKDTIDLINKLELHKTIEIAGINSPALISLSGLEESLYKLQKHCLSEDIYFQLLDLDYPFHSKYMAGIEENFKDLMHQKISLKNSNIKFISTVFGDITEGKNLSVDYWWRNIREPVKFKQAIEYLIKTNHTNFIEIGAHPILLRSASQCADELHKKINTIATLKRNSDELHELNTSLFNIWISSNSWNNNIWFPESAPKMKLPSYPWDRKKYRAKTTIDNNGASHLKLEHPLLGWRVLQEETVWENHLDITNCRELKDHIVGNALVFPTAGYIEMATAANRLMHNTEIGYIDNVQLVAPLVLEKDITHQVQFRVDKNGYFNVRSRPRLLGNDWTVHITGRIVEKTYFTKLDDSCIREVKQNEQFHVFTSKEHYDIAKSVGLNYYDKFQTVKSITFYRDLCKVELKNKVEDDQEYLFGPSIIDGGIHSLISLNYVKQHFEGDEDHTAYLPAGMDSIHFLNTANKIKSASISLLSFTKSSVKADIVFYDLNNIPVMILNGARFNAASLLNSPKQPPFYNYKPILCYNYSQEEKKSLTQKINSRFQNLNHCTSQRVEEINDVLEQLLISYIIRAIRDIFPENKIFQAQYSSTEYGRLHWCLQILKESEYLIAEDENYMIWNSNKEFFDPEDIFKLLIENYPEALSTSLYIARTGREMNKILMGTFDSENFISERSGLYEETITNSILLQPSIFGIKEQLETLFSIINKNEKINLLELGSGIFSTVLVELSEININNINYELITLDKLFAGKTVKNKINISANTVNKNENIANLTTKTEYDIILCSDLSAFDQPLSIANDIATLLTPNGILLLNESAPCIVQLFFNGLKPYNYANFLSSKDSPSVYSEEQWRNFLSETGFKHISTANDSNNNNGRFTSVFTINNSSIVEEKSIDLNSDSVLVIINSTDKRKNNFESEINKQYKNCTTKEYDQDINCIENLDCYQKIVIIAPTNIDSKDVSLDILIMSIAKQISKFELDIKPVITLITTGGSLGVDENLELSHNPKHASLWALMRVVSNEYDKYLSAQMIDLQLPNINSKLVDLIDYQKEKEIILTETAVYSLLVSPVLDNRVAEHENEDDDYKIKLELSKKGSFNNLHWTRAKKESIGKNEVALKPVAVGLNFRDVMYSLGLIPEEVVENSVVGANLGLDVAGVILEVGENVTRFAPGDKVMGGAPGSFSTYNVFSQNSLFKLPNSWSFEDGATIFTVFLTAYCSLVNLARVNKGEKVLIHGAAGGVGLAAIQICNYLGAEIYATAGSDEKRDFLKLLGVKHIYNSRSLEFAEQIKKDTDGKGVDVILNSLANEAIDANLKILKPFGRFVEMGKRDIYENYMMGLKPFRNNLSYFCINIEQLMIWQKEQSKKMLDEMNELFRSGDLKPLPHKIFPASQIKDAFKYLQSSKHIGKLVVNMNDSKLLSQLENNKTQKLYGAYLITGGTNGFGLDTAKWLVEHGVKQLILLSRSGRIDQKDLNFFEEKNIDIIIRSADVNSFEQLKLVFDEIKQKNIDLKGIIHAATVYEDEMIENMSIESYQKVVYTKILGADYLDTLSRDLDLDYFILYSSVTALFGNIGQANYVAGNGYLESLAMFRRSLGLPANFIALGGILDTGLLMRNTKLKKALSNQMGEGLITVEQALMSLDKLILNNEPGFAVMEISVQQMERTMPLFKSTRFDILRMTEKKAANHKSSDFRNYIKSLPPEEARKEVIILVREEIANVLDLSPDEVNFKTSLKDFGFDSLMGFDLAVSLEKRIGTNIPPLSFQQAPNTENIADIILPRILGEHETEEDDIEKDLYEKHGEK